MDQQLGHGVGQRDRRQLGHHPPRHRRQTRTARTPRRRPRRRPRPAQLLGVPAARGAGSATAAVAAGSRWLFETLCLRRVEIKHAVDNPASCHVALNAGFTPEGTLRDAMLHADGWHDMHLHARLSTDT
jgi:Acetyltransferase (GNAT) domain